MIELNSKIKEALIEIEFIKRYEEVDVLSDNSLPFGAVEEIEYNKKR